MTLEGLRQSMTALTINETDRRRAIKNNILPKTVRKMKELSRNDRQALRAALHDAHSLFEKYKYDPTEKLLDDAFSLMARRIQAYKERAYHIT